MASSAAYLVSAGARGINNTASFNLINQAIPTIATTPNLAAVTLSTLPPTLTDTAFLSNGYYETGTITFTLYLGSTLMNTETAMVVGDGSYTTPTGYTLPTTGTVSGIYQWDASYSGDTYNTVASETNATAEQVTVNPASPTITTTPSATAVTLGTSLVTLNDTAVLSGGYYESGTLTFTLYLGSTLLNTETESVNGNGSYTTPAGYTLPTTGTVTGTYQWDASFTGDTNNNSASETVASAEQVTVNPASPTITTTPSATAVTLGTSLVTLNDTAVLSGGYYETGTLTFTLYLGGTLLNTETESVNGNGSYATPAGYTLPTTGTVTGTYQWDASFTGDTNNNAASETNASAEQVTVSPASPTITTTPSATAVTLGTSLVTLNDTAVLSGGYYETGTITFTLYLGSTLLNTETESVNGNGSYTTPTGYTLPTTGTVTGTYQWDASFTGDTNNNAASETGASAEQVTVSPASPTITTTPSATAVTLGTSSVTLNDTAVLSGRLLRDGYDHLYALPGQHAAQYRDGRSQRQRQLHDADRLHAADDGHGNRDVPVGCQLYAATRTTTRPARPMPSAERGDGEPSQPGDHDHTQHDRVTLGTLVVTLNDTACSRAAMTRRARSPSRSTWAARWWTPRQPRSTATAVTPRRPATRCPPRAR